MIKQSKNNWIHSLPFLRLKWNVILGRTLNRGEYLELLKKMNNKDLTD